MSHIIGSKCVDVKDGACIDVCPVDCIYESLEQMFIQPDDCIDCGACIPACPVEAIWDSEDLAIQMGEWEYVDKKYENFGLSYEWRIDDGMDVWSGFSCYYGVHFGWCVEEKKVIKLFTNA